MRAALLAALLVTAAGPAQAASLQMVSNWGASGVPTYVAMYIYVPDKLATNPPVLVVSHYCSGDAQGVFNQAKSGGIVSAADTNGFIMIFPQNHLPGTTRNCWDVGSTPALTYEGGGDAQAIAQMVKYTLTQYQANANRVYAIGTSSGAMMTQVLLAEYPDVFKAGAEFAGVPAGCWAASYTASDQWSGPCAGGTVTHTAQEWGDIARNMRKGYNGARPRVQLWHGLADPTIKPANHTEAIKQWTNVLGLSTNPTSTMTVSLASKSWMRQTWNDACGNAVLDAWGEMGGPHGTSANLNGQYTLPFLALDKVGDVDPVPPCSGDGGVGGASGSGGAPRDGGMDSSGGSAGAGGRATMTGGAGGAGSNTGGTSASGGASGSGGGTGTIPGTGGAASSGGGGTSGGTGGSASGTSGSGGAAPTGSGGASSGGAPGTAGAGVAGSSGTGCACAMAVAGSRGDPSRPAGLVLSLILGLVLTIRRRRGR